MDPIEEIEKEVDAIIFDHQIFWGCDDPVCAVMSSNLMNSQKEVEKWFIKLKKRVLL